MQLKHLALTGFACVVSLPQAIAKPPDVTFLCDKTPEICSNMCYAVRCAKPRFAQTLTFDFPDKETTQKRINAAGCGSCNKCTENGRGMVGHRGAPNDTCFAYPFASTKEAEGGHQVSRCVPASEKKSADDEIADLEKKWKEEGKTTFRINFGNPGGVKYCSNDPCDNDGFEVQDGEVGDDDKPMFKYYKARSGMVVGSMDMVEKATEFTRRVADDESLAEDFKSWMEDGANGPVRMVVDTVMHELPWDLFSSHV
ncbi:hypothetical protein K4F52_004944 [Lecanicillium sp. MT-2017a]|nr:hypothetical protein K4F52_004944 [Lecanicillium sp. MT-2017a]